MKEEKRYNKEYYKLYYQEHKEKRKEYSKQYYKEHKEKFKEYSKKYYRDHKKIDNMCMDMSEIIKDIEFGYKISESGVVYTPKGKVAKTRYVHGKPYVNLCHDGTTRGSYIDRLLYEAFIGWPTDRIRCFILHKDGDITNNSLDNLECIVADVTEDYVEGEKFRRGVIIPDCIAEHWDKHHFSEETIRRAIEKRRETIRNKRIAMGLPPVATKEEKKERARRGMAKLRERRDNENGVVKEKKDKIDRRLDRMQEEMLRLREILMMRKNGNS